MQISCRSGAAVKPSQSGGTHSSTISFWDKDNQKYQQKTAESSGNKEHVNIVV